MNRQHCLEDCEAVAFFPEKTRDSGAPYSLLTGGPGKAKIQMDETVIELNCLSAGDYSQLAKDYICIF